MNVLFFNTIADHIKKEIFHKCGLNLSQTRILLFFDDADNHALTMGELADELSISLSTLSRQLQQKKTKELVTITRSEKNSSKEVKLSEAGLNKVSELKHALAEIESSLSSYIDQNELSNFSKELTSLAQKYKSGVDSL